MILSKKTCLYKVIFPNMVSQFLQLEKAYSRNLVKAKENQREESFKNNQNPIVYYVVV